MSLVGFQTEIAFSNEVPNAMLHNVRWVTDDGTVYTPEEDEPLEPGELSVPISVPTPHEGDTGRLHFALVVEGRKVALVTDRRCTAETNTDTDFAISPLTTARNELTSTAEGSQ